MPNIIVTGNLEKIKTELLSFRNLYNFLKEKDIGQLVGEPLGDYLRRKPVPLSLTIHLLGTPTPNQRGRKTRSSQSVVNENPAKRVQIKILSPKRSMLNWATIKAAVGGKNGYLWGRFRAQANLNLDEGIGKMVCYGSTKVEADKRLRACCNLSDGDILTLSVTEEEKFGVRIEGQKQFKKETRVYPHYFTIINQQQFISNIERDRGKQYIDGKNYLVKQAKIPLWYDTEPTWAQDKIKELLKRGE